MGFSTLSSMGLCVIYAQGTPSGAVDHGLGVTLNGPVICHKLKNAHLRACGTSKSQPHLDTVWSFIDVRRRHAAALFRTQQWFQVFCTCHTMCGSSSLYALCSIHPGPGSSSI
ncbi:hypothetical protein C2E23DRAFT_843708 [Lenzites betulinus]|nr:hypothetical protein C2E23DRAFT_843708 [Lenzites betulinus]